MWVLLCLFLACPPVEGQPGEPLEDSDGDGLPDACETELFGTDAAAIDSDDDDVEDGAEDHDDDGASNQFEQNRAGDWRCLDYVPPLTSDTGTNGGQ